MATQATATKVKKDVVSRDTVDTRLLHRRVQYLISERSNAQTVWVDLDRYMDPMGSMANPTSKMTEQSVRWNRWEVWDSTAIEASQELAASIHGAITSPHAPWYKPVWRNAKLKKDPVATAWLEECGDILFDELCDSDFVPEIQAVYQDLVRCGTGILIEEPTSADPENWKGLDFTAVAPREWFFEEDSRGRVFRGYRWLTWTPLQVLDMCAKRGWECPKDIVEKSKLETASAESIELIFCLFEREVEGLELDRREQANRARYMERQRRKKVVEKARAAKDEAKLQEIAGLPPVDRDEPLYPLAPHMRRVGGVYFRKENGERIGGESGYYEMPAFVCRWAKTSGSKWGHGPGHKALPDTKTLNAWVETEQAAGEKVVDPSWGVTELGLMSDLDTEPGGLSVFRSKDDVWVMESKAQFAQSERTVEMLRASIRRIFHCDQLQLKDSPQMTAMEAQIRYELMQRILGAPLNRIENDLLSQVIRVGFGHCLRAGRFPKMPDQVRAALQEGSADITIEYLGPLARAQRTDKVASIERLLAFAGALMKMNFPLQLVMAVIDMPAAIREMAKALGTPSDLMKAQEQLDKALAEMQAQQQRAAEAALSEQEGKARAAHAQANLALQGPPGGPGAVQPTAAQPGPLVAPGFQPTTPFAQPAAPPMG